MSRYVCISRVSPITLKRFDQERDGYANLNLALTFTGAVL